MAQLVIVTEEQVLRRLIREEISETKNEFKPVSDFSDRMNRRNAGKFLAVSYQTMYNWTRDGVVKEHGYGRKKFYLRSELIEAMKNNG